MDDTPRVPGYTRHEYGERIGATARLRIGAAAAVMDGERLLLTRRTDNGEWCMPGGAIEPGERPAEAAERETYEETGLKVRVTGLVGVYSNPDVVVVYPDGDRVQIVGMVFRAEAVGGRAGASAEVSESRWCTAAEAAELSVIAGHRAVLAAVFAGTAYFDDPER
ncbi:MULTISPECIES: NUDIX domain-containing protein [Kribbella]|uniref:NUDIX domain-containing protein n=1 Tax=Kribbella TaxID=182639 RepID=UPI002F76CF33